MEFDGTEYNPICEDIHTKNEVTINKKVLDVFYAHGKMLKLHADALACHCECLGMNAENSLAVCENRIIPYSDDDYSAVMKKWELIDDEGKPII